MTTPASRATCLAKVLLDVPEAARQWDVGMWQPSCYFMIFIYFHVSRLLDVSISLLPWQVSQPEAEKAVPLGRTSLRTWICWFAIVVHFNSSGVSLCFVVVSLDSRPVWVPLLHVSNSRDLVLLLSTTWHKTGTWRKAFTSQKKKSQG